MGVNQKWYDSEYSGNIPEIVMRSQRFRWDSKDSNEIPRVPKILTGIPKIPKNSDVIPKIPKILEIFQ